MSLEVYTARISSKDPDRLDVTRKSGGLLGAPFAPSWALLNPVLAARKEAQRLTAAGNPDAAIDIERGAWADYVPAFLQEMRASYVAKPAAWQGLVNRARVVLVCYCTDAERCHRALLARNVLPKLGATYRGEL